MSLNKNIGEYRRLVRNECCNYDKGNCIILDGKCSVETTYTSIICKWFRECVLPLDKELEAEYRGQLHQKTCKSCNKTFTSYVKNKQYCSSCTTYKNKERYRKYNKSRNVGHITTIYKRKHLDIRAVEIINVECEYNNISI